MKEAHSIIWRRLDSAGHGYARLFSENSKHFPTGAIVNYPNFWQIENGESLK